MKLAAPGREFSNPGAVHSTSPPSESLPGKFAAPGGTDRWATRVRVTPPPVSFPNKLAVPPSLQASVVPVARPRNRHIECQAQGAAKAGCARRRDKSHPSPVGIPDRQLRHRIPAGEKSGISDGHTRPVSPTLFGAVDPLSDRMACSPFPGQFAPPLAHVRLLGYPAGLRRAV